VAAAAAAEEAVRRQNRRHSWADLGSVAAEVAPRCSSPRQANASGKVRAAHRVLLRALSSAEQEPQLILGEALLSAAQEHRQQVGVLLGRYPAGSARATVIASRGARVRRARRLHLRRPGQALPAPGLAPDRATAVRAAPQCPGGQAFPIALGDLGLDPELVERHLAPGLVRPDGCVAWSRT